jgi:hypothetical protein
MKTKMLISYLSIIVLVILGVLVLKCGIFVNRQPINNPSSWKQGTMPHFEKYTPLAKDSWNSDIILECDNILISTGIIKDKTEAKVVNVIEMDDKKSVIYIFAKQQEFGSHFVFRVDTTSRQIIERYYIPDS